ncbi:MAG TPA: hypothetical protein VIU44_11575, partial [Gaiellaceae bacterium]
LSLSLVDAHQVDHAPDGEPVALWIGVLVGVAVVLGLFRFGLARTPAFGIAAGLFFAGGDISAKLVVHGGWWLLALAPLVAYYALGTSVLQGAFQRGSALTTAGMATLATNAVPIVAGFVLLDESLPPGVRGVLQVAAFASLVVSATFLGHPERRRG